MYVHVARGLEQISFLSYCTLNLLRFLHTMSSCTYMWWYGRQPHVKFLHHTCIYMQYNMCTHVEMLKQKLYKCKARTVTKFFQKAEALGLTIPFLLEPPSQNPDYTHQGFIGGGLGSSFAPPCHRVTPLEYM